MAFRNPQSVQLSAGVSVSEVDLTTVIPAISTSIGAFAGPFAWGPVNEVVTVSDETRLADRLVHQRQATMNTGSLRQIF